MFSLFLPEDDLSHTLLHDQCITVIMLSAADYKARTWTEVNPIILEIFPQLITNALIIVSNRLLDFGATSLNF